MDKKIEIQLGSTKNINSVDVDNHDKISLDVTRGKLIEYDIRNVLSVSEIFNQERQNTEIYRIHGGLEYLTQLNGIIKEYKYLSDFFLYSATTLNLNSRKNIFDSFEFYLLKPSTGYSKISQAERDYIRFFEVIATPDDFEIFNAGFSKNIFNEQKYSFVFNEDFDVSSMVDNFGFPLTELYLYPQYLKETNGWGESELLEKTQWYINTGNELKTQMSVTTFDVGDKIYGDKIRYDKEQFNQEVLSAQTYYITTKYRLSDNVTSKRIIWKYNPFIPLKLRYFSNELKRANTGGTSYEQTSNIPTYATSIDDNGNVVWREILEQGYIDPLTGDGVDYPFVNKKRYLFDNIILNIVPDLSDPETVDVFKEIKFSDSKILNYNPITELNNIGKPCQ